jgi:hypothetical protein
VPAAAVIPAPVAYIKVVAVKKLVVGFLLVALGQLGLPMRVPVRSLHPSRERLSPSLAVGSQSRSFTLKKLECLKQACAMNTLAWNNNLGL